MQEASMVRSIQVWPGKGKPIFRSHLLEPDFYRAILSLLLLTLPGVGCLIIPAWKLMHENDISGLFASACTLLVLTLVLLVTVSLSNPGFLPKRTAYFSTGPFGSIPLSSLNHEPPKFLEYPINGVLLRLKFCKTCNLLRPPRTSHCSTCGVCVERFDHHCPWVGNCIGKKNYTLFLTFLLVVTVNQGLMTFICLFHVLKTRQETDNWRETIAKEIPEIVFGSIEFLIFLFVLALSIFHCFLILRNETTYERLKGNWKHRGENPFNTGFPENCMESLCPLPSPARYNLSEIVESAAFTIFRSAKKLFFYESFWKNRSFCSEEKLQNRQGSMNASDMVLCAGGNSTRGGSREAVH